MINFNIIIAMLAGAQVSHGPGPLDAFAANHSEVKIDMDYVYNRGSIDSAVVMQDFADGEWFDRENDHHFTERRKSTIVGKWGCDGVVEYSCFSSPEDVIAAERASPGREGDPGAAVPGDSGMVYSAGKSYVPRIEALYDGVLLAGHQDDEDWIDGNRVINAWMNSGPGFISRGSGPFLWLTTYPFPNFLRVHFPDDIEPRRRRATLGGFPTEVEIYRKPQGSVD